MSHTSVSSWNVVKSTAAGQKQVTDLLAVEEPLQILVQYGPVGSRQETPMAITMRTPGNDLELVLGFLLGEGIINHQSQVLAIRHCPPKDGQENTVKVQLAENVPLDLANHQRHIYVSSSCGVCGKTSIEALEVECSWEHLGPGPIVSSVLLQSLTEKLRALQLVFERTGGLHAAALFDAYGKPILWREDVGRHNALDKVLGAALQQDLLPLNEVVLLLSGRISFELVQKAIMAGVLIVAAIGAPSSLAVELAQRFDLTLIGFLGSDRFNIYHGAHRINDKVNNSV